MARPKKKNHPLAEALADIGKPKVHTLPKPKESKDYKISADSYYSSPSLRLDMRDFPGVEHFSAGQTVNLAITCEVDSVSTSDNGESKDCTAYLAVTQISDITPPKGA